MPRRYRKKNVRNNQKYRRRRRYRKRTNNRNRISTRIVPQTVGIPDQTLMKMKYVSFITLSGVAGGAHVFRGNSIFDPDQSGTGGQPLGHDQWANFYERYMVYGSSIKCQFLNNNNAAPQSNILINITPVDDLVVRTATEYNEYPYNVNRMIGLNTGGYGGCVMKNYISTKKLAGRNELDDVFDSTFGNNPTRQWYWNIQATPFDGISTISLSVKVEITYYVKLFQRIELLSS